MKTFFKNKKILLLIPFLILSACSEKETSSTSEEQSKTANAFLIERNANDSVYDLLNYSLIVEKYNTTEKIYNGSFTKKITDFPTKTIQIKDDYTFLTKENYSNFLSSGRYFTTANTDDFLVKTEDLKAGVKKVNFYYFSELQNEKIILTKRMPAGASLPLTYNDYIQNFVTLLAQYFCATRTVKIADFGTRGEESGSLPTGTVSEGKEENYVIYGKAFWFTIDGKSYYIGRNRVSKAEWQAWMEE